MVDTLKLMWIEKEFLKRRDIEERGSEIGMEGRRDKIKVMIKEVFCVELNAHNHTTNEILENSSKEDMLIFFITC